MTEEETKKEEAVADDLEIAANPYENVATIYNKDGTLMSQEQIRDEVLCQWKQKTRAIKDRWPMAAVVEVFYRCRGVWSDICYALDCNSSQLAHWLQIYPDKREDLVKAKVGVIQQAEETVAGLLHSANERVRLDAARLILTRLGKNLGWSGTPNITNVQVNLNDADKTAQIKAVFGIADPSKLEVVEADVVDSNCKLDEPKAEQSLCQQAPSTNTI